VRFGPSERRRVALAAPFRAFLPRLVRAQAGRLSYDCADAGRWREIGVTNWSRRIRITGRDKLLSPGDAPMDEHVRQATRLWTLAQPVVSAYVTSVVHSFRDRDDVLQEIAVAAIESFDTYDPARPFVPWVMGVARNQVGLYLRQRRRDRLVFDDDTIECLTTAFGEVSHQNTHQLAALTDCLRQLEGRARRLCQLRYRDDLKPAAIAQQLGMAPNAVSKALQRIRDQLRDCMVRKNAAEGVGG
jgi:RNA polymerase sigma-70 factor (ECF subfamily)